MPSLGALRNSLPPHFVRLSPIVLQDFQTIFQGFPREIPDLLFESCWFDVLDVLRPGMLDRLGIRAIFCGNHLCDEVLEAW